MNICIVGCGYVGLTSAVCLARLGNRVICVDKDQTKIERLKAGKTPIYEPHLEEFLSQARDNLYFTTEPEAMQPAEAIFVAVATPVSTTGEWDLSQIEEAATSIGRNIKNYKVIINKCTAPIGTTEGLSQFLTLHGASPAHFDLISNPEFLREGSAIHNFLHPDRIVIGSASQSAIELLLRLYQPIIQQGFPFPAISPNHPPPIPTVITNAATAEMIKYASNTFLAAKVSFINEIGNICKGLGVDVRQVAKGMGLDKRISPHFLEAGVGFGGSCLPKDTRALISIAKAINYKPTLLEAVLEVNKKQPLRMLELAHAKMPCLSGKKVAVLGIAFKPDTNDVRESPAMPIIEELLKEGAIPIVYDPKAMEDTKRLLGKRVLYGGSAAEAIAMADCVLIVTAWAEFKDSNLYDGKLVIDGRGVMDGLGRENYERVC